MWMHHKEKKDDIFAEEDVPGYIGRKLRENGVDIALTTIVLDTTTNRSISYYGADANLSLFPIDISFGYNLLGNRINFGFGPTFMNIKEKITAPLNNGGKYYESRDLWKWGYNISLTFSVDLLEPPNSYFIIGGKYRSVKAKVNNYLGSKSSQEIDYGYWFLYFGYGIYFKLT